MRSWLIAALGVGAIICIVRRLRQASSNDEIIEQAKEEILLAKFDRWDRDGVDDKERVTLLQKLFANDELPRYIDDIRDPDAVKALVTERAEASETDG